MFAVFIIVLLVRPEGLAGAALGAARLTDMIRRQAGPARSVAWFDHAIGSALPCLVLLVIGVALPLFAGGYWGVIATRACVYWVLVAGLNLLVGFAGQLAIGWVALLTLGAYVDQRARRRQRDAGIAPLSGARPSRRASARSSASIVGLPALRLRTFYFAITTLGFATIVTQIALAWQSVTGGGVGVPGPVFPPPFDSPVGLLLFLPRSSRRSAPG